MCGIKVIDIVEDSIIIEAVGLEPLTISTVHDIYLVNRTIYDDWFSRHLKHPCQLLFGLDNASLVSFANTSPILLISQSSVNYLQSQVLQPVQFNSLSFRPNIVMADTLAPFIEDSWIGKLISISGLIFKVDSQCERCQMICIDQETGIRSKEPFSTLAKTKRISVLIF
jgi:uncharacterized protein YcbX